MIFASLLATAVLCTVELEADGTYFAVCQGRRELMETEISRIMAQDKASAFCTAYEYGVFENYPSFVVICD